jgi:hypothetical protein
MTAQDPVSDSLGIVLTTITKAIVIVLTEGVSSPEDTGMALLGFKEELVRKYADNYDNLLLF